MICTYYSEEVIKIRILLLQNLTHFNTNRYQFFFIHRYSATFSGVISQPGVLILSYQPQGVGGVAMVVVVEVGIVVVGTVVLLVFILSTTIQELPTNVGISITTSTTRITTYRN